MHPPHLLVPAVGTPLTIPQLCDLAAVAKPSRPRWRKDGGTCLNHCQTRLDQTRQIGMVSSQEDIRVFRLPQRLGLVLSRARACSRTTINKTGLQDRPARGYSLRGLQRKIAGLMATSTESILLRQLRQPVPSGARLHHQRHPSLSPASNLHPTLRPGMLLRGLLVLQRWRVYRLRVPRRRGEQSNMWANNREINPRRSAHGHPQNSLGPSLMDLLQSTKALVWQMHEIKGRMFIPLLPN